MIETHIIELPKRTGRIEINEEPKRILVKLRFDKYGFFGDDADIQNWLLSIFEKYDPDKRPIVFEHPQTGEVAVVCGDEKKCFALVQSGKTVTLVTQK